MTPLIDTRLSAMGARLRLVAASVSVLALLIAGSASGASIADDTQIFRLPAEPIEGALVRFAVQAGVSVGGLPARGCSGRSRAVSGAMSPAQALAALLPPGCGYEAIDAKSFRIVGRSRAQARPEAVVTAPPPPSSPGLDELVVTAEKRPELLSRSASALSVLSASDLEALGGTSFDEVASQIVGVAVTNLGSGRNKIFVRGLSDGSFTGQTQSTVGLYLDDVPITYNAPDPDLRLVDVERVEVLRGPQGTLYGSGSIGGIVQFVTVKPDVTMASGAISLEGMLTQRGAPSSGFEGMANLPLADGHAALRAVVYVDERGGYIDNPLLGLKDVNHSRRSGGRLAALTDLPEGWTLEAGVAHQSIETADAQYTQGPNGSLTRDASVREPHDNEFTDVSATASHAGDIADLKISTAFIDHTLDTRYDATGAFRAAGGSRTAGAFDEDKHIKLWTTEGLYSSNAPGPFRWLAGAFLSYSDEIDAAFLVGVRPLQPARSIYQRHDALTEGALYGEVAYDISPRLTATIGARGFETRVDTKADDFSLAAEPIAPVNRRLTDLGIVPKLRLSFAATPEIVIYGQIQEGYRAGGFNIPPGAGGGVAEIAPARFSPDRLWSFELGAGLPLLDHALTLRGAVFYADWPGLQTDQRLASGLPLTVNIGDGSNAGIEGEAVWRPNIHLEVRANLLLEDPQITRAANVFPARRDIGLPGVPYEMGSTDVRYRWEIGRLNAEASAQVAYVGRSFLTFDGGIGNAMGGYASGRVAGALGEGPWRASVYIENVADERGNTFAFGNPFSRARATQATPLRPRTVGFGLTRSF